MNHVVPELLLVPELATSWIYMAARSGTMVLLEELNQGCFLLLWCNVPCRRARTSDFVASPNVCK
jgi:hypothetical protein